MDRATRRWSRILGIALAVAVVAYFAPPVRAAVVSGLAPAIIWTRHSLVAIGDTIRTVRQIPRLAADNAALAGEVVNLRSRLIGLDELRHENQTLRRELQLQSSLDATKTIPANVVSRVSSVVGSTLVINKGADAGFVPGMPILSQGFVIGFVETTSPKSCEVKLISSSASLIPVILQQSRTVGLLRGGVGGMVVEDIARGTAVAVGEAIVTSPLGSIVPGGLPVGEVSSVEGGEGDVFLTARVRSPVDIARVEVVVGVKE